MVKIATKKRVDNNAGLLNVISGVDKKNVKDVVDFGHFTIVILKDGAIFRTSTGFEVRCKAWTTDIEGKVAENSLFSWLCNVVEMKKECEEKGNEEFPGTGVTYNELLDAELVITEANLTYPINAFVDPDKAAKFANEQIDWLGVKMKELEKAINTPISEETDTDLKKNFEHGQQAIISERVLKELEEESGV